MQLENDRKRSRHRERRMHKRKRSRSSSVQTTKTQSQIEATSRQTRREQKLKQKEERRKSRKPRRRIFPIWLRIIIILLGCIGAVVGGVMVGYGLIGEGVPSDALNKEIWQHIIDIVQKKE